MGQQQLILLVLATVIIGIAIVVGIRAFTENDAKANADAMTQDAVRMASDIQAWVKKPEPFGGAAAGEDWTDATFGDIGYAQTLGVYTNINGEFELTTVAPGRQITGTNFADDGVTVRNEVHVLVCGTTDADIFGGIFILNEGPTGTTPLACP